MRWLAVIGLVVMVWAIATAESPDRVIKDFISNREPPLYPAREAATKTIAVILALGLLFWLVI